jgi:hypothetical protein
MPLNDYTFQLNSGVLLNDSAVTPFVDVSKVSGLDSAPYRETIRDHEGTDGGFIDAEFETGRDITIEGIAYGDVNTIEAFFDTLKANYAPVQNPIPLVLKGPGVNERVVFVKPRGVRYSWDAARRIGSSPVQFLMYAEDPRIYDNVLVNQLVQYGGPATTGFAYPFGFNLSFGAVIPPDGAWVTNSGNRPAPAILTITGPVDKPRIINDTDSKQLTFNITLAGGETLVIDLANRTVLLNGVVNRRNTLQSPDWFLFRSGKTFLRYGGTSNSSVLTTTTDFESGGVPGWTIDPSCTFVNSTAQAHAGIRSGLMTSVGTPTQAFVRKSIPVIGGQSYTCSLWAYSTPGYASVAAAIDWFDSLGAYITTFSSSSSLAAATWANRSVTGTAPGNAASASYGPSLLSNPPNNTQAYFDDVAFTGPAYGASTLTVSYRNAWR